MYHVALDLTQEQVKQLKLRATRDGVFVNTFVKDAVLEKLENNSKEENK